MKIGFDLLRVSVPPRWVLVLFVAPSRCSSSLRSGNCELSLIEIFHDVELEAWSFPMQTSVNNPAEQAPSDSKDLVVFSIVRDSQCSECGAEIAQGSFLSMEAGQPLCMPCARLDDLEYLPSGDAALTRRAAKYSERTAVVVRFSRSRGRYERQGILVEASGWKKPNKNASWTPANAPEPGLLGPRDARSRTAP